MMILMMEDTTPGMWNEKGDRFLNARIQHLTDRIVVVRRVEVVGWLGCAFISTAASVKEAT